MKKIFSVGLDSSDSIYIKRILEKTFPATEFFSFILAEEVVELAIKENPDLIFLGSQNSTVDLPQVCARFKSIRPVLPIPVVIFTDKNCEDKILENLLQAGADAFFTKPFKDAEFIALVRTVLKIAETENHLSEGRAMQLVKEKEESFRYMFENNPQPMWIYDLETLQFLKVNRAAVNFYGYNEDEFLSMTLKDIRPKEDIEALLTDVERTNRVLNHAGEWRHVKKNGDLIHVEIISHILTFNGKRARHVAVRDITDRKLAEMALRENEENLRITLNSIGDAVVSTDLEGKIVRMNPVAEYLTGWKLKQAKGKYLSEIFHIVNAKTKKEVKNPVMKVLSTGKIVGMANHTKLISKKGKEFQISDSAAPITDSRGKIKGVVLVFRDVTAEYEIREKLETTQFGIDHANIGIFRINENGKIEYVNQKAAKDLGYSVDELLKMNLFDIDSSFNKKSFASHRKRIKNGGESTFYTTHKRKDGSVFPIEVTVTYFQFNDQLLSFSFVKDITEQKKANAELKDSEEKFRKLFHNHSAIKLLIDPENGKIIEANNAASKFYGWSTEELTQMRMPQINTLPDNVLRKNFKDDWQEKKIEYFEFKHKLASGEIRDVEVFSSRIIINGKELIHAIVHDITNKKIAERQLRLLSRSVEQSPVSIVVTNNQGKVEYVNRAYSKITGYSPSEIKGRIPNLLNPEFYSEPDYKIMHKTIYSGMEWKGEFLNKTKQGDFFWENVHISPVFNSMGEITHFVAINENITEKKKMIEDLVKAKEKAEESDRLKSAFLANMSHEIRTPMNGILGFADLLKTSDISSDERQHFVEIIESSGNRMLATINDLIDISKIEAGMIDVKLSEINVNEQLEYLYYFFQPEARRKGLTLEYEKNEKGPAFNCFTDRDKLMAILTNLIKNAIKYTESGGVKYGFEIQNNKIQFYVSDTGIGIDKNYQKKIFERFIQADLSTTRPYEGAGLGLSITKAYVELLNGNIKLISAPGKGSRFYVSFPLQTEEQSKSENIENEFKSKKIMDGIKDLTLLVVEDDKVGRIYIETLFKNRCKNVFFASNGVEAVEMCKNNSNIDLILMDIKMP
ncbi:MAG: PAS domain S-box protein, partial [Prolixibacteraceae bacterium]|nr:PAS domain S-box protein [Prolixibacteraceae bacterium]